MVSHTTLQTKSISEMPQASVLKRDHVQIFLVKMIFYYHANKTHFHKKGFALDLVLRERVLELRNGLLRTKIVPGTGIRCLENQ